MWGARVNNARLATCPAWAGENLDILFCTISKAGDGWKLWGVRGRENMHFPGGPP